MSKKIICIIYLILITFLTTSCWNYVGLNELTVVAGTAIDKKGDTYILTFEIYDLQNTSDTEPIKSKLIESTGKTIFEAVRNAKKKVSNKLYFSNSKVLIVSKQIASEDGLNTVINWFQRDSELRETLLVAISEEEKASTILESEISTSPIRSSEIELLLSKDQNVTLSTETKYLYQAYNSIKLDAVYLTLPLIHLTNNYNSKIVELNGISLFKKDKLVGTLNPEETKYYLLATGKAKGGIITITTDINGKDELISLEVRSNSSSISTEINDSNFKANIEIELEVTIGEVEDQESRFTADEIQKLEKLSGKIIKSRINDVINIIQENYGADIFGLGEYLYRNQNKQWEKYKDNWDSIFENIKFDININTKITSTGFLK